MRGVFILGGINKNIQNDNVSTARIGAPREGTMRSVIISLIPFCASVLAASLPHLSSTTPEFSSKTDTAFVNSILTSINQYRHLQNASELIWNSTLASYAQAQAVECQVNSGLPNPYGQLVGGASPADFGASDWTNISEAAAAENVVAKWYDTRAFYVNQTKYGDEYSQLVSKSTSQIGCAWTPKHCPLYVEYAELDLFCEFDPPGNVAGYFGKNVSCKDCSSFSLGDPNPTISPLNDDAARGGISALQTDMTALLNQMRNAAHVKPLTWNRTPMSNAELLATQCYTKPQMNQVVGVIYWSAGPYTPGHEADRAVVGKWNSLIDVRSKQIITDPQHEYFGCAWSNQCSGYTYYLWCVFNVHGRNIRADKYLTIRNVPQHSFNLSGLVLESFNNLRKEHSITDLSWSADLANRSSADADFCNGRRSTPALQLWAMEIATGNVNFTMLTQKALNRIVSTAEADSPPAQVDLELLTDSTMVSVGCAWSTDCGGTYYLYCSFDGASQPKLPMNFEGIHTSEPSLARNVDTASLFPANWTQGGFVNYTMTEINWYFRISKAVLVLSWNWTLAYQALDMANGCNRSQYNDTVLYEEDFDAPNPDIEAFQIDTAILQWMNDSNADAVLTETSNTDIGCAWDNYCYHKRYLYCTLWGVNDNGLKT